jgi:hypothetical protein
MATESVNIPGELFSRLQAKAEAAGKTVDQLAAEALSESLNESIENKAAPGPISMARNLVTLLNRCPKS